MDGSEPVYCTYFVQCRQLAMMSNETSPYSNLMVRSIWGKADTVLLIFAGAAAEFALNKAVDWLYFTGRLPSDPLGRLFSTVAYARDIIFSGVDEANAAIDKMRGIHTSVEQSRGANIPDAAYRDVLFMLIYYSISAYELIERRLSDAEKEEVVQVFLAVGRRMGINGLPSDYPSWSRMYYEHTMHDLERSKYTKDLFRQYRKHLGAVRYFILIEAQKELVSERVRQLLGFQKSVIVRPLVKTYRISRLIKADRLVKALLLPREYKQRIYMLDRQYT